jgi:hypothetical protein
MTEVYLMSLYVASYETRRIMALLRGGALRRNLVTMFVEVGWVSARLLLRTSSSPAFDFNHLYKGFYSLKHVGRVTFLNSCKVSVLIL